MGRIYNKKNLLGKKMFEFLKKRAGKDIKKDKNENSILNIITSNVNKTKNLFSKKFNSLFYEKNQIDENIIEELEKIMVRADINIEIVEEIISYIETTYKKNKIKRSEDLIDELEKYMLKLLSQENINFNISEDKP